MEDSKWADQNYAHKPAHVAISTTEPSISDPSTEEFAQTRSPDDLFADDFTPIPESEVSTTPAQPAVQGRQPPSTPRGSYRGRHGRRGGGSHTNITRNNPPRTVAPADVSTPALVTIDDPATSATPSAPNETSSAEETSPNDAIPKPGLSLRPSVPAVRGDRTATGGVKRDKLTEEELAARMEAIKLKNANLVAAHERASADEASFQAREAEALQRRRVERQARQEMMGERERNRMRKLQAQGGREWDEGKERAEAENGAGRGKGFRRGAFGGVAGGPRTEDVNEDRSAPVLDTDDLFSSERRGNDYGHRRRGGRGSGRGQGRGGYDDGSRGSASQQHRKPLLSQQIPDVSDFPALPTAAKKTEPNQDKGAENAAIVGKTAAGQSWAEEMEDNPASHTSA